MASSVSITLDTTAPTGVTITIDGGASFATVVDVTAAIAATGADVASMKIYGDVDDAFAPAEYRALEANAPWITYAASKAIRVSAGDGVKTIRIKVRDDVFNATAEASDTITLDTSLPTVTVQSGPTPAKISKIATKDTSSFSWQSDVAFVAYKVKAVLNANDPHTAGTQIPTTAGSTNVSGAAGAALTTLTTTIKGTDLETASAGDATKIVKVFVQESSGSWST